MPITNPTAIVDAVAADLIANSGLTPASTWRYAEPRVVMPDACPLLAVWCESTDFELVTAGAGVVAYERRHTIVVAWDVAGDAEASTGGTGDPASVAALDAVAEQLVVRLAGYAAGVPSFGSQVVATLRSRKLLPLEGVIWSARLELIAEEAS